MGIINIRHLIVDESANNQIQALAVLQQELTEEHRRGEHPLDMTIRECPLCQAS